MCGIAFVLVSQVFMLFIFEFNWDEFLLLDWVYDWSEGKIILPLQTIYLRFFVFLQHIPQNEIYQIIIARCIMFCCFLITSYFIFSIAKRYFSIKAALLCVLTYISFSFVFRHGVSFRMDTMVTTLLMFVVWCLLRPNPLKRHHIFAGLAFGFAGMVTIKSIFYAPTIAGILLIHWAYSRWNSKAFFEGLSVGVISLITFGVLYLWHSASLNDGISGTSYIGSIASGSLIDHGFFPQINIFAKSIIENMFFWMFFAAGCLICLKNIISKNEETEKSLKVLSLALPLLSLSFYLHSYNYYYSFLIAPASILIAPAYDKLMSSKFNHKFPLLLLLLAIPFLSILWQSIIQNNSYQKQTVEMVHQIFPEPTSFIDRTGMISSFDQEGFFMAGWQMREYYRANTPIMNDILVKTSPEFIVANVEGLDLDALGEGPADRRLLAEDEATLKNNYIHHWGKIYVPGKRVMLDGDSLQTEIILDGTYTVETDKPVLINGKIYKNRQTLELSKGMHDISADQATEVTLRWGDNLFMPEVKPLGEVLFRGF